MDLHVFPHPHPPSHLPPHPIPLGLPSAEPNWLNGSIWQNSKGKYCNSHLVRNYYALSLF